MLPQLREAWGKCVCGGGGCGRWSEPLHSNKNQPELRELRGLADFTVLAVTILLPAPVFAQRGMIYSCHGKADKGLTSAQKLALRRGHLEFQSNSENFETLTIVIPRKKKYHLINANTL